MNTPCIDAQDAATERLLRHTEIINGLVHRTRPPATPAQPQGALETDGLPVSAEDFAQWKVERETSEARRRFLPLVTKEPGRLSVTHSLLLEAASTQDGKLTLQAANRDRQLDQQDFRNAVFRERFEWEKELKNALKAPKKPGGLSRETLEKIERELKLF